jgi:hypothetical protein
VLGPLLYLVGGLGAHRLVGGPEDLSGALAEPPSVGAAALQGLDCQGPRAGDPDAGGAREAWWGVGHPVGPGDGEAGQPLRGELLAGEVQISGVGELEK